MLDFAELRNRILMGEDEVPEDIYNFYKEIYWQLISCLLFLQRFIKMQPSLSESGGIKEENLWADC